MPRGGGVSGKAEPFYTSNPRREKRLLIEKGLLSRRGQEGGRGI